MVGCFFFPSPLAGEGGERAQRASRVRGKLPEVGWQRLTSVCRRFPFRVASPLTRPGPDGPGRPLPQGEREENHLPFEVAAMDTRPLGRTGLKVSVLGQGG